MNNDISIKFQTVTGKFGEREVRYLTAGSGPVVFLLHQSPKSADEYKPLMDLWSNDFTMIAPDTPGELDILGHDSNALGVNGAEVAVLEETDDVRLSRLLEGEDSGGLEPEAGLEVLSDLADEALSRTFELWSDHELIFNTYRRNSGCKHFE